MRFRLLIIILLVFSAVPVLAGNGRHSKSTPPADATDSEDGELIKIDTRPAVTVSLYYMKNEGAHATLLLLSGGDGGIGMMGGAPTSRNFLVRSRGLFTANGFNVAIFDKKDSLSRSSSDHIDDLRHCVAYLKKDVNMPVWVIGTSMGTISATALATVVSRDEIGGIILTSSITSAKEPGAVPFQKLDTISVPVLVVHHEQDACKICSPRDVGEIVRGLKNAPIKNVFYIKTGSTPPSGNPCNALHYHGFIGVEEEVVGRISAWIKKPTS